MSLSNKIRDQIVTREVMAWYETQKRDYPWRTGELAPWQALVVEVLLQQTNADRVAAFAPGFFQRYDSIRGLGVAGEEDLAQSLAPLGLQRQRASRLTYLAAAIAENDGEIPSGQEELEALPGVGAYVAAAFRAAVHGHSTAAADVNFVRLVTRVYGIESTGEPRRNRKVLEVISRLARGAPDGRTFNWAVLDFGALVCKSRSPTCGVCPLLSACKYARQMNGRNA